MNHNLFIHFLLGFVLVFISKSQDIETDYSLANKNPIIFFEDFEKETFFNKIHKQFPEDHSFVVVDSPVYAGKYAGKFELRYGDRRATKTGRRSEVLFPALPNRERWYSFMAFFPSSEYKDDFDSELISQWHNCCGTPTIGFRNKDGRLLILIGFDRKMRVSQWANFDLGRVPKDNWQEFVFHIIHSETNEGLVEVWQNGKQVVKHLGPNMEKGSELPRWKIGIYKSTWDEQPTRVDKRVIYFDNIKVGNQFADFNLMSN
jgi:hypothetical protein